MYFCRNRVEMANKSSILSSFLIDGKYRFWRYVFFVIVGAVITSSMVFVAYMDCAAELGNRIYLLCLSSCICYAVAMLVNYHYLIPKFLLKGKHVVYSILIFATAYLLPTLSIVQEYFVRHAWGLPHRISNYASPLIEVDNLSSCMMLLICFLGVSASMLFRQWKDQEEQLNMMEHEHLQSEINKLKGQATPVFLSKTLKKASVLIPTDAKKANEMLMELGKLLRYQLYDCNRDEVLLTSEINHLNNFLRLKQLNEEGFEYDIQTTENRNNLFIPPLLFISLIQDIAECNTFLKISIEYEDSSLSFRCEFNRENALSDSEAASFKRRLGLQFPGKYEFVSEAGIVELEISLP